MNKTALAVSCSVAVLALALGAGAEDTTQAKVPVMDGGAGPCSLALTVTGSGEKPVYNATVKVHISYGFAGARRLDLQAGTNSDGKVKFTGLPARVHHPPLEFQATKDELQGSVTYDPTLECQAQHEITLQPAKSGDTP